MQKKALNNYLSNLTDKEKKSKKNKLLDAFMHSDMVKNWPNDTEVSFGDFYASLTKTDAAKFKSFKKDSFFEKWTKEIPPITLEQLSPEIALQITRFLTNTHLAKLYVSSKGLKQQANTDRDTFYVPRITKELKEMGMDEAISQLDSMSLPSYSFKTLLNCILTIKKFNKAVQKLNSLEPDTSKHIAPIQLSSSWQLLCLSGDKESIEKAFEKNIITKDLKDKEGRTPVHYAAISGHADVLKKMKELKFNIHAKDGFGASLIHFSALNSYGKFALKFINLKKLLSELDNHHRTVLHYAALADNPKVLTRLERELQKIEASSYEWGFAPRILRPLLFYSDSNYPYKPGFSTIKLFLFNNQDADGATPWLYLFLIGSPQSVIDTIKNLLVQPDIKVFYPRHFMNHQAGLHEIHYVIMNDNTRMLETYLDHFSDASFDPAIVDKHKNTLLHYAALYGNADTIKKLHQKKAPVLDSGKPVVNEKGETILHCAILSGKSENVVAAIEIGSNELHDKNNEGKSALDYAEGKPAILKILRDIEKTAKPRL